MSFRPSTLLRALGLTLACFSFATHSSAQDGGILVYNAQHTTLTKAWADAFTKETGIKVTIRNGSDSELANQLVAEGSASPADVFLTENSPAMSVVSNAGLFAKLPDDTLAQVPRDFRPLYGNWTGIAARSTVFVYNKAKLTPATLPKSIMDLSDSAWKGRWGAAPAGADFQAIVSAILQLKGEASTGRWLEAMKKNVVPFRGNSAAMKAVNEGEIEGAVIYHYYYFGDAARGGENSKNVALHYFKNQDPGAFVSVSGAGVLASSKQKPQAQAFVKWLTAKSGQDILRNGDSYEYAVGVGAASHSELPALDSLQAPRVETSRLNTPKTANLMAQAGLL